MDCKEFEENIYDYFSDPDFDWKLRNEMDAHYFECDNCFEIYKVAELLANKDLMAEVAVEATKIRMAKAEKLLKQGDIKEFITHCQKTLRLCPENEKIINSIMDLLNNLPDINLDNIEIGNLKQALQGRLSDYSEEVSKNDSISLTDRIKELSNSFIKQFYPDESPSFNLLWRTFNDIDYKSINKSNLAGALAAAGASDSKQPYVTPEVIICIANSCRKAANEQNTIDKVKVQKFIDSIADDLGVSKSLVDQMKAFVKNEV
ncbi:MAG: hypothetical protein JRD71_00040 [Deltaproteobacteria bacterium]|nr:hypothetical protein [Deltaproteobacteria bacterium]